MCSLLKHLSYQQDVVEKNFVQLTYTDAVELLLRAKKKFEYPVYDWLCFLHKLEWIFDTPHITHVRQISIALMKFMFLVLIKLISKNFELHIFLDDVQIATSSNKFANYFNIYCLFYRWNGDVIYKVNMNVTLLRWHLMAVL